MKVLVTGGAGFIASAVVDKLIEKKYEVIIVDNLSSGYKENVNKKAKFYKVDIRDAKGLDAVFKQEKPERVIHAAAQNQVVKSVEDPVLDATINIIGSINLLECCKKHKTKKIVYLSTGGAMYGEPEYLPADEDHPINPISPYGASKHAVEHYLHLYKLNFGVDFISLRFTNVYGPRDDISSGRVTPLFICNFLKGKAPFITGDGSQGRDFIHVDDVANAVVIALEIDKTKDTCFNIGTGKVISIKELFYILRDILKLDVEPEYVPARTGEVQEIYLKAQRAKEQLGWSARKDISTGMKETVEWFKGNWARLRGITKSD